MKVDNSLCDESLDLAETRQKATELKYLSSSSENEVRLVEIPSTSNMILQLDITLKTSDSQKE
jgi:hypothetical protein